jgi:hypothetical protein
MVFTLIVLFFVLVFVIGLVAWRMMKGEDAQGRKK